jgi:outer membrane murein-binding lipoprotein Lpp
LQINYLRLAVAVHIAPAEVSTMTEASTPSVRKYPVLAVVCVALVLLLGGVYALHQRSLARQNAEQKAQMQTALQQTQAQVAALTTKIDAVRQQQAAQPMTVVVHEPSAPARRAAAVRKAEDARWKRFQTQLDEQGRAIESARTDLASTRTDLSGSIARTHDELVVLQKRGERNYYEFDLAKSKQFARNGPIGISLRKANTKHQYADLELMVDDVSLSRKHVNLYEPVMFYAADAAQPAELVINSITKDHIRGYISEPKYPKADLAALSNTAQPNTSSSAETTTDQRKRLPLPH